jgi:hypothetical protein
MQNKNVKIFGASTEKTQDKRNISRRASIKEKSENL